MRKYVDCRDYPSETNCTVALSADSEVGRHIGLRNQPGYHSVRDQADLCGKRGQPGNLDAGPGSWDLGVGECEGDVVEPGRQDLGADPLGDLFRGAGDAEPVEKVVRREP